MAIIRAGGGAGRLRGRGRGVVKPAAARRQPTGRGLEDMWRAAGELRWHGTAVYAASGANWRPGFTGLQHDARCTRDSEVADGGNGGGSGSSGSSGRGSSDIGSGSRGSVAVAVVAGGRQRRMARTVHQGPATQPGQGRKVCEGCCDV